MIQQSVHYRLRRKSLTYWKHERRPCSNLSLKSTVDTEAIIVQQNHETVTPNFPLVMLVWQIGLRRILAHRVMHLGLYFLLYMVQTWQSLSAEVINALKHSQTLCNWFWMSVKSLLETIDSLTKGIFSSMALFISRTGALGEQKIRL